MRRVPGGVRVHDLCVEARGTMCSAGGPSLATIFGPMRTNFSAADGPGDHFWRGTIHSMTRHLEHVPAPGGGPRGRKRYAHICIYTLAQIRPPHCTINCLALRRSATSTRDGTTHGSAENLQECSKVLRMPAHLVESFQSKVNGGAGC